MHKRVFRALCHKVSKECSSHLDKASLVTGSFESLELSRRGTDTLALVFLSLLTLLSLASPFKDSTILVSDLLLSTTVRGTILRFFISVLIVGLDLNLVALLSQVPVFGYSRVDISFDLKSVPALFL